MSKRSTEQLGLCIALSFGLLACASSSGTPSTVDAAIEHATDVPTDHGSADRAETSTPPDARDVGTDLASDHADAQDSGLGGNGSGGAGTGGAGMGGNGAGMGGNGVGGAGMGGGQGGADAGTGGMSTGTGGATPDAAPDMAPGGTDGAIDSPTDSPPVSDAPTDSAPACGAGCPANVEPQSLVLWISADVGVTCDSSSPPRVTGWKDRTPGSTVTLAPVATKDGPRCDGAMLNGTPLPYFDHTTTDTDIDNGVLKVDLTPLDGSDYTVFVVERRRNANAGFILGTDVPAPLTGPNECVDGNLDGLNAHLGYRFGYQSSTVFEAGSYTFDPITYDCNEPSVSVSAFSTPQAALEIDFLAQGNTRTLTAGSTTNPSDDVGPMGSLMQGYLGRAFNLPPGGDSRYRGEIAEVVIYKAALNPTEVTAVSGYLKARWGL